MQTSLRWWKLLLRHRISHESWIFSCGFCFTLLSLGENFPLSAFSRVVWLSRVVQNLGCFAKFAENWTFCWKFAILQICLVGPNEKYIDFCKFLQVFAASAIEQSHYDQEDAGGGPGVDHYLDQGSDPVWGVRVENSWEWANWIVYNSRKNNGQEKWDVRTWHLGQIFEIKLWMVGQ